MLGELVQRSRSVQTAIHSLIAHLHLQTRGGYPTHAVKVPTPPSAMPSICATCRPRRKPTIWQSPLNSESFRLFAVPAGGRLSLFSHGVRKTSALRGPFRLPVAVGADRTEIVFNKHWLDQRPWARMLSATAAFAGDPGAGDQQPGSAHRARSRGASQDVTNGRASERLLSDLLAIPMRTLRRLLDQQGTSFRELIEEARYEVARQLLVDTDMLTAEIAATLDYADASAFTRAFRRWTGLPPAAWRIKAREPSAK